MFFLNPKNKSLSVGLRGEKAAQAYLKKIGYSILETNFCNTSGRRLGEIDIIAKQGDEIVFIEVKTRNKCFGEGNLPEENINRPKLYKLNKAAIHYLSLKNITSAPYRFDAISVLGDPLNNVAEIRHLKNIFI